ncbi:MAG: RNA methyltransferase [Cytophagales bacterium]|nr:RNA methyltransferase [Cytophagales bacterium]
MLSIKQNKLIKSLQLKKYRKEYGLFVVEGKKNVVELLNSDYKIEILVATNAVIDEIYSNKYHVGEVISAGESVIASLSTLENNTTCLAVAYMGVPRLDSYKSGISIVLDGIQDPGNLGTIIRSADWFGISQVICSSDCVDFFNPKTISATMGSFTRVVPLYTDIAAYLSGVSCQVYGTYMDGISIFETSIKEGVIVFGNEANGIDAKLQKYITKKITIPRIGSGNSLNVAVAASITMAHVSR